MQRTTRRLGIVALTFALGAAMTGCSAPAPAPAPTGTGTAAASGPEACTPENVHTLKRGQQQVGWGNAAFQIANAAGYFEQYGVAFEEVQLSAGGQIPAIIGGDIDFAGGGTGSLMSARDEGIPVVAFASDSAQLGFQVVISDAAWEAAGLDDDADWEDRLAALEGLSIAGGRPGTEMDNVLTAMLVEAGLDPTTGVERVVVERGAPQIAALTQGRVDGIIITPPDSTIAADQVGGHMLIDLQSGDFPPFDGVQYGVYVTSEHALTDPERRQAFGCFILALNDASDMLINDFETARDMLIAGSAYEDIDIELLEASISEEYMKATSPIINPANFKRAFELSGRTPENNFPPSSYYVTEIADEFLPGL